MKKLLLSLGLISLLVGCGGPSGPDVSKIRVDLPLHRFDLDFFAMDTNHIEQSLAALQQKYPFFYTDFMENIVVGGGFDSLSSLPVLTRAYISHSRPLFDSARQVFRSLDGLQEELTKGFQHVGYYYPSYKIPKLVIYCGLIGDPSVAISRDALAIGLQMYLGKNFGAYNTPEAIDRFPQYISRRFEPAYIPANCFQNIGQDIYPEKNGGAMIDQFVEKGKQWWLLNKFLPDMADSLKTGFTQAQLDWCRRNEGLIWNYIIEGNDLYTTDPGTIQHFIGEAPKTDGMPDASPGNIGQWIGWQIVNAYSKKNSQLSVSAIMATDARKIFEGARYKPH